MESQKSQVKISDEEFLKESLRIVDEAKSRGVVLRILGGFAVFIHSDHSEEARQIQHNLGRLGAGGPTFTDLDLGGYARQWKNIKAVLEGVLKLEPDRMTNAIYGNVRLIYTHPVYHYPVDIFIDKLEFSHTVPFVDNKKTGRLELDYPTISLADIVLEKLQIHQLNRKDMIDVMALLYGHEVGSAQTPQVVDGGYIARMLSDDWGFWYDATNNLKLTEDLASSLFAEGRIPENQLNVIKSRIQSLRNLIDSQEKTKNWKKREKDGTKKAWYREVSDL
jgi:hypothetical protein